MYGYIDFSRSHGKQEFCDQNIHIGESVKHLLKQKLNSKRVLPLLF